MAGKRVLVVDDEKLIVKGIRFSLEQDNMEVDCAYDGEEALEMAHNKEYDIILLDVMLPKLTGFEVCQQIREFSNVPVIMLTAKGDDMDKILGLEYGADDYITKPFNILEVKARIKAILRRMEPKKTSAESGGILESGDLKLDRDGRRAYIQRKEIGLTAKEFEVLELLMDLGASDEQLDCPFLYASAKAGHAVIDLNDTPKDMAPLFEAILKYIPAPEGDPEADTQVLISTIDYNEYVGRIGVGKVENGTIAVNQELTLLNHHDLDKRKKVKISKLYEFDGLNKVEVKEATIGAIVAISGIADIHIGDTLCAGDNPEAIPFQKISEPTIAMNFIVNDSPLAGQEGKYITSRHLRDRLYRELNTDVSLRVEDTETTEAFKVSGRGELHLSVLIENMRREGYEFAVSKPEVLYKTDERGKKLEPMEIAYVDVPEEFSGTVIQKLSERKGELQGMSTASDGTVRLEFHIPSRGLIGFRGEFLTSTKGTGIINTMFDGYAPYKGDFQYRKQGSLIAFEAGEAVTYGLFAAQERGTLFIGPGAKVYSGMVIGQNGKAEDIELNVCKTKHLTNTRSSSADDALKLTPPRVLSLEQAIDFIDQDELLEVTPVSLRIRKRLLDSRERKRAAFRKA